MSASPPVAFSNTLLLSIFLLPAFYYTPVTASLMEWISVLLITSFFFPSSKNWTDNADFIEFYALCTFEVKGDDDSKFPQLKESPKLQ